MIFQAWVMRRCGGKPTEAVRRIEAVGGQPIDRQRVYRALRKPMAFPARFAQLVVAASGGECTLLELIDAVHIREHFSFEHPDMRRRGLEYELIKLEKRRDGHARERDRLSAIVAGLEADIASIRERLDSGEPQLSAAG